MFPSGGDCIPFTGKNKTDKQQEKENERYGIEFHLPVAAYADVRIIDSKNKIKGC